MDALKNDDGIFRRDYGAVYLSSRGVQGLTCSVVFTTLATIFVGLRLYTRIRLMKKMESNDWMVFIALVGLWKCCQLSLIIRANAYLGEFLHLHGS